KRFNESESSKKTSITKQSSKGKSSARTSKSGKSMTTKESVEKPVFEIDSDDVEQIIDDMVGDDGQPPHTDADETQADATSNIPKKDWFKEAPRPETLDSNWNTVKTIDDTIAMINKVSKHKVFSTMRILSVVSVQVEKRSGYGYLKEIVIRRADQKLYKFKEAKSKNLRAISIVAKFRFSVATPPKATNKVSRASSLTLESRQLRTLRTYMKNKITTSRKWQKWFEHQLSFNWSPKCSTAQKSPSVYKNSSSARTDCKTPVTTQKWVAKLSTPSSKFVSCDAEKNPTKIVSPFSNPERAFCKLNKKEQSVESEGTSQKDFEFESALEFEFHLKEEEMAEDGHTMADLAKTTRTGVSSAITFHALMVNNFEIKGQFLHMIFNQCQFSGSLGSITTWDQMQERLLARFFPPALSEKLLSEINNFVLYKAWERLKKYLRQYPQHGLSKHKIVQTFYKGIDRPTRNKIDNSAGGTIMHKTPNEAYKLIEDIAVHTHEWYAPQDGVSRRATTKAVEVDGVSEIATLTNQMAMFIKTFDKLIAIVVKMLVGCESYGGPHLTRDCDDKPMSSSEDACWANHTPFQQPQQQHIKNKSNFEELMTQYIAGQNAIMKDQQASIHELKTQVGQLLKLLSQRKPGSLPCNTETNPNVHVNAITTRSGKRTADPLFQSNKNVDKPVNQKNKVKSQSSLSTTHVKTPLKPYEPILLYLGRYKKEKETEQYDMNEDSKVPLILGRPFLSTSRCLVDVYEKKMTLRIDIIEPPIEENIQGIFEEDLFDTNFIKGKDMNMSSEEVLIKPAYLIENDPFPRSNKDKEIKRGTGGNLKMSFEEHLVLELKDLCHIWNMLFLKANQSYLLLYHPI
nr:hypothetical protein [Tanacetum cinerariifolium]